MNVDRHRLKHAILVLLFFLSGCATHASLWEAQDIVRTEGKQSHAYVSLRAADKTIVGPINRAVIKDLLDITDRIDQVSNMKTELFITDRGDPAPNAYAAFIKDRFIVALNLEMLRFLGSDTGMYAALISHEIAHGRLQHQKSNSNRRYVLGAGGIAAGIALGPIGIPVLASIGPLAATYIDNSFSREQEREADKLGLKLMFQAGYSLDGGLRFYKKLSVLSKGTDFFSTHPGGEERLKQVKKFMASRTKTTH